MNAKTAKLIRAAARYSPREGAQYSPLELQRVMQMQAYETYERTIREMGPVSPGAMTNARQKPFPNRMWAGDPWEWSEKSPWIPRSGNRRMVTSRVVEKIRYLTDGKTPARALLRMNVETKAYEPQYILIPCAKPVHLLPGSPKRVYRELKRLQQRVGLDELYRRLEREQLEGA